MTKIFGTSADISPGGKNRDSPEDNNSLAAAVALLASAFTATAPVRQLPRGGTTNTCRCRRIRRLVSPIPELRHFLCPEKQTAWERRCLNKRQRVPVMIPTVRHRRRLQGSTSDGAAGLFADVISICSGKRRTAIPAPKMCEDGVKLHLKLYLTRLRGVRALNPAPGCKEMEPPHRGSDISCTPGLAE